jgi:ribosome-binding ATPase
MPPLEGSDEAAGRTRLGQIKIGDARLDFLERAHEAKKKVQAELTVLDFAPERKEQPTRAILDPNLPPLIRNLDALLLVIPEFGGRRGEVVQTLESVEAELVFFDLEQAERKLSRQEKEHAGTEFERAALAKLLKWLETGKPLRALEMNSQEQRMFAAFGFLSRKPALAVINCEAENARAVLSQPEADALTRHGLEAFRLAAAFEAELWQLDAAGRSELLHEVGLDLLARDRLVAALCRHLGLITFYTASEREVRAWLLARDSTALEAAALIHSDIARGFIRAEVVSFNDFAALGSYAKAREAGKLRLEGKNYVVNDGDILHVRFKV